jgi:hypothetical protein
MSDNRTPPQPIPSPIPPIQDIDNEPNYEGVS